MMSLAPAPETVRDVPKAFLHVDSILASAHGQTGALNQPGCGQEEKAQARWSHRRNVLWRAHLKDAGRAGKSTWG